MPSDQIVNEGDSNEWTQRRHALINIIRAAHMQEARALKRKVTHAPE